MTQPDDRPVRWGILGTGGIAHAFARDLALQPDGEVVAVGSRSQASADALGDEFGVPHRHASYQALVNDVDAVHVSTTHPGHHDAALLAINAGKAVLGEPTGAELHQARPMTGHGKEGHALRGRNPGERRRFARNGKPTRGRRDP
jgi:predicted dehydrogenase